MSMWGINPDSQRWQDMMKDFKRGESVFNQVGCLSFARLAHHGNASHGIHTTSGVPIL